MQADWQDLVSGVFDGMNSQTYGAFVQKMERRGQ
jgi:hypothetical protein